MFATSGCLLKTCTGYLQQVACAYYGTTPARVRKVLDSGQLISPGTNNHATAIIAFAINLLVCFRRGSHTKVPANGETDEVFLLHRSDTALWERNCQVGVSIPIPPVLTWHGISVHHSVHLSMLRPTESIYISVQPNSYHVRPQSNSDPRLKQTLLQQINCKSNNA